MAKRRRELWSPRPLLQTKKIKPLKGQMALKFEPEMKEETNEIHDDKRWRTRRQLPS